MFIFNKQRVRNVPPTTSKDGVGWEESFHLDVLVLKTNYDLLKAIKVLFFITPNPKALTINVRS